MTIGVVDAERDKYSMINFEETELRLGLPGGSANDIHGESSPLKSSGGKRGFSETANVDLKLNLSSSTGNDLASSSVSPATVATAQKGKEKTTATVAATAPPPANDPAKPPAK